MRAKPVLTTELRAKLAVLTGLLAWAGVAGAATGVLDPDKLPPVSWPTLASSGAQAKDFVPKGWVLEKQVSGDLNADGKPDLALVIRQNAASLRLLPYDDAPKSATRIDTNPRIVLVALADGAGGYKLAGSSKALIPRHDNPSMEDPFQDLQMRRGSFTVSLLIFMNAGGWETTGSSFTFRHEGGCVRLIGFDQTTTHRATLKSTSISANLLSGKMKTSEDDPEAEDGKRRRAKPKEQWQELKQREPICLEHLGNGLEFSLR